MDVSFCIKLIKLTTVGYSSAISEARTMKSNIITE